MKEPGASPIEKYKVREKQFRKKQASTDPVEDARPRAKTSTPLFPFDSILRYWSGQKERQRDEEWATKL